MCLIPLVIVFYALFIMANLFVFHESGNFISLLMVIIKSTNKAIMFSDRKIAGRPHRHIFPLLSVKL